MKDYVWKVLELDDKMDPKCIHYVKMPKDIKGGWYWQISSGEAFLSRGLNTWYKHRNGKYRGHHFMFKKFDDFDLESYKRFNNFLGQVAREAERKHYPNLWEFYKCIGYDYKANNIADFIKPIDRD